MFQEPWGHIILIHPPTPWSFLHHGTLLRLAWRVLVLTQVPSLTAPCLPQGELLQMEVLAGKPAEQREAGVSLSCPHQLLHPQLDEASGDPQRVPGGGPDIPTRLHLFPPKKTPLQLWP